MKQPLVAIKLRPVSPKLREKLDRNGEPLFVYEREVPVRFAAAIQLGTPAQRDAALKRARNWLRAKLEREKAWTDIDRAYLL